MFLFFCYFGVHAQVEEVFFRRKKMRCWCVLVGLMALTVPMASDESGAVSHDVLLPATSSSEDFVGENDETARSWSSDDEEYFYDDDEEEFLPDPEALTDEQHEDEDGIVLDENSRMAAEALIQELDVISNSLQDDDGGNKDDDDKPEELPSPSALSSTRPSVVSPADVKQLETLLKSAGLTPDSPLMQNLMQQRHRNAIPASALGPSGPNNLGSLLKSAPINVGASPASVNSLITPGMTKKNVEEIKLELKHMLFGPDNRKIPVGRPV